MRICVGDLRIGKEERQAILEVLSSERISEGSKTRKFEDEFAKYIGTKYCVAMNSGTSALIAGLMALTYCDNPKINPHTKVMTTPVTFVATVNAIAICGFQPVFVDVDPKTFVITAEAVREYLEAIDDPTEYSLVVPVHLMGYPVDMDEINKVCNRYGLLSFEDAAQAHGSVYKGRKCGSLSLAANFSFYIAHNIQVGEMGALTTDNDNVHRLAMSIKDHGRECYCRVCTRPRGVCPHIRKGKEEFDPRFLHSRVGYNFKTTEFAAALGLTQLKKVDWIVRKRQENVQFLNEQLDEFSDILQLPHFSRNVSYFGYPMVIKKPNIISRSKLTFELERNGIETRPLFGCIPTQQPAYECLRNNYKDKLPNADYVGKNGFYIGCHQYLQHEDLVFIARTIRRILRAS